MPTNVIFVRAIPNYQTPTRCGKKKNKNNNYGGYCHPSFRHVFGQQIGTGYGTGYGTGPINHVEHY